MTCDSTFRVKPDLAKGKIVITDDEFVGTKKLKWINMDTANVGETVILIPNITTFTKLKQTKDRVYILKNTDARYFFYMQEEDESKDEEILKKVNDLINEVTESEEMKDSEESSGSPQPQRQLGNSTQQQQLAMLLNNPELLQRLMAGQRQQSQIPQCIGIIRS